MAVKNELNLINVEFDENKYSHVFLIETNNLELCEKQLIDVIKKLVNADEITAHQLDREEYVDLITIRPDGKNIKKDQIESLQERLGVKPVVGSRLYYIITPADCLNEVASNKLLKTIEEPNENNIGFLITNNVAQILPTIKSRCELIEAFYSDTSISFAENEEIKKYAENLIHHIEYSTLFEYHMYINENKEIIKNAKEIAINIKDYYNRACITLGDNKNHIIDEIIKNNNFKIIVHKAQYLNKLLNKDNLNMNSDLLLEKIYIDLKGVIS